MKTVKLGCLFGKKQNSKEQKNTATTTDDPNRIKKITDLLKE